MKFYELDNALQEAIHSADKPLRMKIDITFAGYFESVFEQDILEANFYGLKEKAGGTTVRGELLLDNSFGIYVDNPRPCGLSTRSFYDVKTPAKAMETPPSLAGAGAGTLVNVSFTLGEGLPYFKRFQFFIDDKGIQDIREPGRKRFARIGLVDLSVKLEKSLETKDWNNSIVFAYNVVCDKTHVEKSLVHEIAKRARLTENDIDCSTIPVVLPYVQLRKSVWAELSSLARAYRCHLECGVEKSLVFAHSPYQTEAQGNEDSPYTITGDTIFYLRKTSRADYYRNTIRLKINLPVSLERQEIWRYNEPPVLYDDYLQPHYPFKYPLTREIEAGTYEANYRIMDGKGKERPVIYASEIDTKEEAENRLDYDGGTFSYSLYDTTTYHDKAILTLHKEADGDVYYASIHGRPIVLDLNRSCFARDLIDVAEYGTAALNVTGNYFSDYEIESDRGTLPQYQDWVWRELNERKEPKREFTIKTHRALFNARVGAGVKIAVKNEELRGTVQAYTFLYKRNEPFIATLKILEEGRNNNGE